MILDRIQGAYVDKCGKQLDRPAHLYLGKEEFRLLKDKMFVQEDISIERVPGNTYYGMKIHWVEEESHLMCI